jgi:flavin reductase (DIM6/NTAB) family NADH-FMN oxidoreductase RutF
MAFAVQRINYSYDLFGRAKEFVLAVPGESLVSETMICGSISGRNEDKAKQCGLEFVDSEKVEVPSLASAIANIELRAVGWQPVGDHAIVTGEVCRYAINPSRRERPLLSLGPDTSGYELLERKGIHRLGVRSPTATESESG